MSSPFPGMDPYLELPAYWSDFLSTFVNYWREAIAEALPPDYEASLGERVYLVDLDPDARKLGYPDVSVSQRVNGARSAASGASAVATLEPVTIPLQMLDGPRESFVEILHLPDHRLVTVLELLSPANKEQPGRTQYLAKRDAILYQKVHLVELDLLVGGKRPPLQQAPPPADYYYFLSRADARPDCQVFSWSVRQPLPRLPVPLRAPDADIQIDLAAVFATAYEHGRYRRRIAYRTEEPAHLRSDDAHWAKELAQSR